MASSDFQAFGAEHLAALAAILTVSLALSLAANRFAPPRASRWIAAVLALVIAACKIAEIAWYARREVPWQWLLPLHLCDLAALILLPALLTRITLVRELAYFWGAAGTTQALLTPDLRDGFPDLDFWLFFVPHGLVIAGVCLLVGSLGFRPERGSILRVFLVTALACIPAGLANWRWETNYMYLREKPGAATLLDFMGPWPWYLLVLVPVSLAFLSLWYAPFWLRNRRVREQ